jgi:hypothetical protein
MMTWAFARDINVTIIATATYPHRSHKRSPAFARLTNANPTKKSQRGSGYEPDEPIKNRRSSPKLVWLHPGGIAARCRIFDAVPQHMIPTSWNRFRSKPWALPVSLLVPQHPDPRSVPALHNLKI